MKGKLWSYQATQWPQKWPLVNFMKSLWGFRHYLDDWLTFGRDNSSKYNCNFPLYRAIAKNFEIPLSAMKSAKTPKMSLISILNVKIVKCTKFEQYSLENKWFQFFISGTPDSWQTFCVFALIPSRVAKLTC